MASPLSVRRVFVFGLRTISSVVRTLLLGAVSSLVALGQAASPAVPVPLSHLYWHFLVLQNHLDRAAAVKQQQGQAGSMLRSYYQKKTGLSDSEFAKVRDAGLRLEPQLQAIDAQVRAVIDADRARHPRVLARAQDLPPVPSELLQLQQKREQTIEYEVDGLKLALGSKYTAKLETFLTQEFSRNVTRTAVAHPHSDPARRVIPPFAQSAVQ